MGANPADIGMTLPDALLDDLDDAFRRLRRSIVKPPYTDVPVPSLGRPLAIAKVLACTTIHQLGAAGSVVTVKDVAAALHLQHSTVSRLLGEVEADGLLARDVDQADRRRTQVTLTDTGLAVVRDSVRMRREAIRTVLQGWPEPDIAQLIELLTRLAESAAERLPALLDPAYPQPSEPPGLAGGPVGLTPPTGPGR